MTSGHHAEGRLTADLFRARARAELDGRTHLAGWLPQALDVDGGRSRATDTRPWTVAGRTYAGFGETFCRVLSWYKLEKIGVCRDLGWALRPDAVARVEDALRRLIAAVSASATLPTTQREWLASYDVGPLARYTALDDRFETLTGRPIETVLDFGSGIGRQAYLWSHQRSDVKLYSVDAIESLYLLQADAYRELFGSRLIEYFEEPSFAAAIERAGAGAVVHLPTWRLSAIPDASVDVAICVQVLQELPADAVMHVLAELRRIVRPNGVLYIRDNEFWTPVHAIRIGRALLADGWRQIFRYTGDEGSEIEGVPRVWINAHDDTARYFRAKARLKRALLPSYSLSFRSWRDLGLPI